jgi:hypothetical protein
MLNILDIFEDHEAVFVQGRGRKATLIASQVAEWIAEPVSAVEAWGEQALVTTGCPVTGTQYTVDAADRALLAEFAKADLLGEWSQVLANCKDSELANKIVEDASRLALP